MPTNRNAVRRKLDIASVRPRRPRVPSEIEAYVLINSRRRCALCYGLRRNLRVKKGQIAHLDGDRSNNDKNNLAFLCKDHHDDYDSISRQSKGFTEREVKFYRKRLYNQVKLPPLPAKTAKKRDRIAMFFDYEAVISASFFRAEPENGWTCVIEIIGENNNTREFEVVALAVNDSFASSAAALRHGKQVVKSLGIECIDTRLMQF